MDQIKQNSITRKKVKKSSQKRNRRIQNTAVYIFLSIVCLVWLLPFVYLLIQSFRKEPGALTPYFWPKEYTLDNYIKLFTDTYTFNFPKWYLNTFIIAVVTCFFQTILTLMVSYAFSRLKFKGKQPIMSLILIIGMFPGFLSMIAIYYLLEIINMNTSIFSLILVYCGGAAMGYYICKGYFDTIPYSLDEAAKIDGANANTIFFRVIMPLAKPIVIYMLLMGFVAPWGDFMFAAYLAKGNQEMFNVAVGLQQFLQREVIYDYFTRFCAGAVLVSIPIVVLFFLLQRYYVEGITGGSVKG